jgi:hypothetical protein
VLVYPPWDFGFCLTVVVDLALTALLTLCRPALDHWHHDDYVVARMVAAFYRVSQDLVRLGSSVVAVDVVDVT